MTWQFVWFDANIMLFLSAIALTSNAMIANFRTHTDIMELLSITMKRHMTGGAIIKAYDTVTYQQHMRARFFFRDPWLLYPQIVRDAIANPDVKEELPVEVKFGVAFGPPPEEGKPTLQ